MPITLDECCASLQAKIANTLMEFRSVSPTDRDIALRAVITVSKGFSDLLDICGELNVPFPEKTLGVCLAYSCQVNIMNMTMADTDLSITELMSMRAFDDALEPYLCPQGTLLKEMRAQKEVIEIGSYIVGSCRLSSDAAALICAAFDPFLAISTLEIHRQAIFEAVTVVAMSEGMDAIETLKRAELDNQIVQAANIIRQLLGKPDLPLGQSFAADVAERSTSRIVNLEDARKELDELIGLGGVKLQVQQLMAFLTVQNKRKAKNLASAGQTLHFVFTGNPGTGKTTVARILGRVLCGIGVLQKPNVVECSRADLVAAYVGQTAIKTTEVIEKARGGILFIDEAYSLSNRGFGEDFGLEAIETLLKKMEDYRDSLVVIVAGYPDLMAEFIATNPGLKSRFTKYIGFSDYEAAEMCQIFDLLCKHNDYSLDTEAKAKLSLMMNILCKSKGSDFGNGRLARNVFDDAMNAHAMRVAYEDEHDDNDLTELTGADISFEMSPELSANPPDLSTMRWSVVCPKCSCPGKASLKHLGKSVSCKKCNHGFVCPWYEVIA